MSALLAELLWSWLAWCSGRLCGMPKAQGSVNTVDDVIVAPQPAIAGRDPATESAAFMALSQTLARKPDQAVQRLVETALKLTQAGSAGVSLEDTDGGERVFRWVATAGEFAARVGGTMPREFSPCGTVVHRGRPLVMQDPVRFFPYVAQLQPGVRMALLAPFARHGKFVGTVWIVSHREDGAFSEDDLRVVQTLTTFATTILDTAEARPTSGPQAQ